MSQRLGAPLPPMLVITRRCQTGNAFACQTWRNNKRTKKAMDFKGRERTTLQKAESKASVGAGLSYSLISQPRFLIQLNTWFHACVGCAERLHATCAMCIDPMRRTCLMEERWVLYIDPACFPLCFCLVLFLWPDHQSDLELCSAFLHFSTIVKENVVNLTSIY